MKEFYIDQLDESYNGILRNRSTIVRTFSVIDPEKYPINRLTGTTVQQAKLIDNKISIFNVYVWPPVKGGTDDKLCKSSNTARVLTEAEIKFDKYMDEYLAKRGNSYW